MWPLAWHSLAGRRRKEPLSLARSSPMGAQHYMTELYVLCCRSRGPPYPKAGVAAREKYFWRSREQPQPSIIFLKSQGRISQGMRLHGSPKATKVLHSSKGPGMQLALTYISGEGKQSTEDAHGSPGAEVTLLPASSSSLPAQPSSCSSSWAPAGAGCAHGGGERRRWRGGRSEVNFCGWGISGGTLSG